MGLSALSTLRLNQDREIPMLGIGTYQMSGPDARKSVGTALRDGYRLVDTAQAYKNEHEVGLGIGESGIPREELFVTTKLSVANQDKARVQSSFEESLKKLGTGYIDLFLIHWPVLDKWQECWKVMEELPADQCRAIGVSNFTIDHLKELAEISAVVPAVDQVEFHPFLLQAELQAYCQDQKVVLEAYSPLMHGHRLDHAVLQEVAKAQSRSVPQILIRWGLQHGVVEIPKSTKAERIRENLNVFDFELSTTEMGRLDGLHEDLHFAWDPRTLKL
ncbi:MAG: aldo/keto reductase [Thermoplasmata archaeon]|nr:aldo/keto reductase [Thermoplasmata archaeon]